MCVMGDTYEESSRQERMLKQTIKVMDGRAHEVVESNGCLMTVVAAVKNSK